MGQKVNPIGLRLGVNKTWQSKWYVDPREYADTLHEDLKLRKALLACPEVAGADISEVEITRKPQRITLVIATARPGIIIGQKGANIEKITQKMEKLTTKKVQIKIKEIKKADCNAQLIAQNIAKQLEGRGAYRRAMKNAISRALLGGVEGIKIKCSGRLGGAEIARTEQMKDGRVPTSTMVLPLQTHPSVPSESRYGSSTVRSTTVVQRLRKIQQHLSVERRLMRQGVKRCLVQRELNTERSSAELETQLHTREIRFPSANMASWLSSHTGSPTARSKLPVSQ